MKRSPCVTATTPVAIALASLVVALGVGTGFMAGCGGGGGRANADGGHDGGATLPAGVTSCQAYCDTAIASQCTPPLYGSIEECRMAECADLATAPAQCQTVLKAYYDCERTQPNICQDDGCMSEADAIVSGCGNAALAP